eukprot:TRINITY_DN6361_c0_g1_i1.p1 TRINITY_DN6361_c0_g1~~TRINITY_DN6361_c0_g1_i1.p1  ORF type:complete len:414 (-),score=57.57 TRINITY_DN6361_c0_g1_i1:286-1527(-)
MNMELGHYNLLQQTMNDPHMESVTPLKKTLSQSMFQTCVEEYKILALQNKAPAPPPTYQNHLRVLYSQNLSSKTNTKSTHRIPCHEEKTLDAPGMVDDYYLNLLDWSSSNVVAVALASSVYLWDASEGNPETLVDYGTDNTVTSVSWSPSNNQYLAVGSDTNTVQIFDVTRGVPVRKLEGHQGRVGSLSWNGFILSSGSYDSTIINWDVRSRNPRISTFSHHQGEVCGLKWSLDGRQLASGGNDNILNVWKMEQETPQFTLSEHQAAVKALAWCPWQSSLLASGGGTADRTIKFWNTQTGTLMNSVDTESQVCALQWSLHRRELVSSHGFSKNQLCVWKYPTMTKLAELTGHSARVLHLAQSPDGTTFLSAGADETLKFWSLFDPSEQQRREFSAKSGVLSGRSIASSLNKIR